MEQLNIHDKVAMYVGGGLIVLGTLVIGLLEMVAGSSHPVTTEGEIVTEALVPMEIRSYIIIAGLGIWGLYAIFKVFGPRPRPTKPPQETVEPYRAD